MALRDLLAEHGVDVHDRAAVYALLRRLPLAARARVVLWEEYSAESGVSPTEEERRALRS